MGRLAPGIDLQIPLATRNTADFEGCGITLVNPSRPGSTANPKPLRVLAVQPSSQSLRIVSDSQGAWSDSLRPHPLTQRLRGSTSLPIPDPHTPKKRRRKQPVAAAPPAS